MMRKCPICGRVVADRDLHLCARVGPGGRVVRWSNATAPIYDELGPVYIPIPDAVHLDMARHAMGMTARQVWDEAMARGG